MNFWLLISLSPRCVSSAGARGGRGFEASFLALARDGLDSRNTVRQHVFDDVDERHRREPLAALEEQRHRARRLMTRIVRANPVERSEDVVSRSELAAHERGRPADRA